MIAKTKMSKKKVVKVTKQKSTPKMCKNTLKFKKQQSKQKVKRKQIKLVAEQKVQNEDLGEDSVEDVLDMIDDTDLDFLKCAVVNKSYHILNKIRYPEQVNSKSKRQKLHHNEELEDVYEKLNLSKTEPTKIGLLPIKTSTGVIPQTTIKEVIDEESSAMEESSPETDQEELDQVEHTTPDFSEPISTIDLLASRNQALQQRKIHIGTLSAGFLENPEEKVTNLKTLLSILDEDIPEIYYTVRKLVIVSLLEIFKDILPAYEIKHINLEGVKLKKDTLKLQKYEDTLLLYYKNYLQKLEKYGFQIIRKKGSKHLPEEELKLSIVAVQAMCELLITHPYFNFAQNIAQTLVPLMNNRNKTIRDVITNSLKTVFKEDKKGEITLKILRLINKYIKLHSNNVYTEMLEILLVLNLKGVSLDQQSELDKKQKKLKAHKSRILQLSKKERKRSKKLKEVEKEMLETKAEENTDAKIKNRTEITKIVFNIYFRILKSTENTKLLGSCFEGLAKFAHYINLEFSLDIITALDNILNEDWLKPQETLHCMQTVFAILSGQGEALNVDPTRFYSRLYKNLLTFNLSTRNDEIIFDLIKTLDTALIKRRKKITNKRTLGFVKRITTLSLQLVHDGSIACLGIVKIIMALNRFVDILLDTDSSVGEGKFLADVDDPEYSNASNTALYEMISLRRHYHPIVSSFATHIANYTGSNDNGRIPGIYSKMSPEELFTQFRMSEMAFNPAVPIPKVTEPKTRLTKQFTDLDFYDECKHVTKKYTQDAVFTKYVI